MVIFNEGNPGRTDVINGSLSDANGNRIVPTIPVAFTSFATGEDLYNQYNQAVQNNTPTPTINLDIQSVSDPNRDDYNVIAESKGGDPNHVLVVDAHLDAIYGAGMLDNASGSATILDVAQMMAKVKPQNKMRFIWFGGEELGLLGSQTLRQQPVPDAAQQDRLRPGRRRDGDAELRHRHPRPGGAGLLRADCQHASSRPTCTRRRQIARDQAIAVLQSRRV